MSGDIIAASPARRRGARAQLAGMAGAVAAAVAVWLIARYGAGMQLRTPGVGPGQRPASLAVGLVAAESAVISVAAWGTVRLIERTASRPRRVWIIVGLLVMVVSLAAPLAGHGLTGTQRLALACMHLMVAAVLIPVFALTITHRRPAGHASGVLNTPVGATGHRQASGRKPPRSVA
jgi:hypothetical protein